MKRIVVLASRRLNCFQQKVLTHLLLHPELLVAGAVIDQRPGLRPLGKLRRELRRGRGGYVAVQIASALAGRIRSDGVSADAFFASHGIPVLGACSLCAPETLAWIRVRRPDALFRTGFGIIREPVLSMAPHGVLSYHHGDLARYRGQPAAFWELYHGEPEMKVTLQRLNETLDAGEVLAEMSIPIRPDDSWSRLRQRAYDLSDRLALEAVLGLDEGRCPGRVPRPGPLFTTPNLRQWLALQVKVAIRRVRVRLRGALPAPVKPAAARRPAGASGSCAE